MSVPAPMGTPASCMRLTRKRLHAANVVSCVRSLARLASVVALQSASTSTGSVSRSASQSERWKGGRRLRAFSLSVGTWIVDVIDDSTSAHPASS